MVGSYNTITVTPACRKTQLKGAFGLGGGKDEGFSRHASERSIIMDRIK